MNGTQEDISPINDRSDVSALAFSSGLQKRIEDKSSKFEFYLPIAKNKPLLKSKYTKSDMKRKDS